MFIVSKQTLSILKRMTDQASVLLPKVSSIGADLRDWRKEYKNGSEAFLESHLPMKEPFAVFQDWFELAKEKCSIWEEANSFSISTVSKDGKPSSRMVLLKSYGADGFRFFTNYGSHKGQDIDANPNVAMLFYYPNLNRQIRIEGTAEKLPPVEADEYWVRRPALSQASGAISDQSKVVASRDFLLQEVAKIHESILEKNKPIPRPSNWGGYIVRPTFFEFWQGQSDRLHDRIIFRRPDAGETLNPSLSHIGDNGWIYERLAP